MNGLFKYAVGFTLLIGLVIQLFELNYHKNDNHIRGDGLAYYSYIPALIIHHDIKGGFYENLNEEGRSRYWFYKGKDGAYLPKMTMGLAYFWAPGVFAAHHIAGWFGYEQNGWSAPYQWSIVFTAWMLVLVGCWGLFQVLQKRFSKLISFLTLMLLIFATNLLHYAASEVSMSHVYSFSLLALLLYMNDKWREAFRWKHLFVAAFLLGWITLIRPTNLIVAFIFITPFIFDVSKLKTVWNPRLLLVLGCFLLPVIPQLLYWKLTTDSWVYYSYANEAFYWLKPHIFDGLFSYRNGWLLYTPLMILAIFGLFKISRIDREWQVGAIVVLIMHIYITFSWWCWYYGDSLSIRPMIDIYPLLSFGVAGFISWALRYLKWAPLWLIPLLGLILFNNLNQVKQYNLQALDGSRMTKSAFWDLFLNPDIPSHLELANCYREVDTDRLRLGLDERVNYDTSEITMWIDTIYEVPEVINSSNPFGKPIEIQGSSLKLTNDQFIELSADFLSSDFDISKATLVFEFNNNEQQLQYQAVELEDIRSLRDHEWNTESFYIRPPKGVSEVTVFKVYFWNRGKGETRVRSFSIRKIGVEYSEPLHDQ